MTGDAEGERGLHSESPPEQPPGRTASFGLRRLGLGHRLLNVVKTALTIHDHLSLLERDAARNEARWNSLSKQLTDLTMKYERLSGEFASIDKRIAEKDKMLEALFSSRLEREVDRAVQAAAARAQGVAPRKRGQPA